MRREIADMIIGLVLIMVGIIVMFAVFFMAMNLAFTAGDFFRDQVQQEETVEGPEAQFDWEADDRFATFTDRSREGDSTIDTYDWNFGDGNTSVEADPPNEFRDYREYEVSLTVVDRNGESSTARANVNILNGEITGGRSEPDSDGAGFDADFGNMIIPIAIAILVGILFVVMFAVGAAITKAGWNILKPKPEKLKIKLKPREMEVKQVGTFAPPPQQPVQQVYEQPQEYSPPPPEDYE